MDRLRILTQREPQVSGKRILTVIDLLAYRGFRLFGSAARSLLVRNHIEHIGLVRPSAGVAVDNNRVQVSDSFVNNPGYRSSFISMATGT